MPSIHAQYNEEIVQAQREALAALRELLAEETDPLERRRLAIAILKARPVKEPAPEKSGEPVAPKAAEQTVPPVQTENAEAPHSSNKPAGGLCEASVVRCIDGAVPLLAGRGSVMALAARTP